MIKYNDSENQKIKNQQKLKKDKQAKISSHFARISILKKPNQS